MVGFHALVDDCDDDVWGALTHLPGLPDIGVSAHKGGVAEDGAGVVVVPLPLPGFGAFIERERDFAGDCGGGVRRRVVSSCALNAGPIRCAPNTGKSILSFAKTLSHRRIPGGLIRKGRRKGVLDALERAAAAKLSDDLRGLQSLVETCHIPAVKSLGAGSLLEASALGEKSFKMEGRRSGHHFGNLPLPFPSRGSVPCGLRGGRSLDLKKELSADGASHSLGDNDGPVSGALLLLRCHRLAAGCRHGKT